MGAKRWVGVAGAMAVLAMLGAATFATISSAAVRDRGGRDRPVGAVYSQTNDFGHNAVVVFDRYSNGLIRQRAVVPTGGQGGGSPQHGCTDNCPFLDDQGALALAGDGQFLFAVNAGSDTISSFRISPHGLTLVGQVSSGGDFPYSLTTHGNLLYVLNSMSLDIMGFRISGSGKLAPIAGSHKPLSSDAVAGAGGPRQIQFDNTGRVLAVTLLGVPDINTFVLNGGVPGSAIQNPTSDTLPFGFDWDKNNNMVVSQVHDLSGAPNGTTSSYALTSSGHLTPIDTEATNGFAPCWLDVSGDGRYAYVANTGAGTPTGATITVFSDSPSGNLTQAQVTPQVVVFPFFPGLGLPPGGLTEFAKTDVALTPDDDFLYVLSPGVFTPASHIDMYAVEDDGTLTLLGLTPSTLAGGLSGLIVT